jgi:hypothetical protein
VLVDVIGELFSSLVHLIILILLLVITYTLIGLQVFSPINFDSKGHVYTYYKEGERDYLATFKTFAEGFVVLLEYIFSPVIEGSLHPRIGISIQLGMPFQTQGAIIRAPAILPPKGFKDAEPPSPTFSS